MITLKRIVLTQKQAEEMGKYLLTLSQAAAIGTVSLVFKNEETVISKASTIWIGTTAIVALFALAMKILREVKK